MKSIIDWNELVPKLPKKMRDDLYLEAVAILSKDDDEAEQEQTKKKKNNGYRIWEKEGDGHHLAAPGRKFKINRNAKAIKTFRHEGTRAFFQKLVDSHNEIITYEGIASIFAGHKGVKGTVNMLIANFWARRLLDVVP